MTNMHAILDHLDAGTLIRGDWGDGRERACLYSALVTGAKSTANCPSEIMPQWLADATPDLDDKVPEKGWSDRMRRYGVAATRWHAISPERWEYIRREWTAGNIDMALEAARKVAGDADYWPDAEASCVAVSAALRGGGDMSAAAGAARVAVARAEAEAAQAAVWAARAAVWAEADAAWAAADAAWAAARAAAESHGRQMRHGLHGQRHWETCSARAAAWADMFDRLMALIEKECGE